MISNNKVKVKNRFGWQIYQNWGMDFKEVWREDGEWAKKESINCWCRPRWRRGSGNFNLNSRLGLGRGSVALLLRTVFLGVCAVTQEQDCCSEYPTIVHWRPVQMLMQTKRVGTYPRSSRGQNKITQKATSPVFLQFSGWEVIGFKCKEM